MNQVRVVSFNGGAFAGLFRLLIITVNIDPWHDSTYILVNGLRVLLRGSGWCPVEEYHRKFFTNYARGTGPRKCGGIDIHIGGLAHVGVLCAFFRRETNIGREAVREHVNLTHRAPEMFGAADAMARIIWAVLEGSDLRETIFRYGSEWISKRKVELWSREPDEIVIGHRVSSACYIADAFPTSLYLAWKYADDFEAGVIANTD